jgi:hypothetical protein
MPLSVIIYMKRQGSRKIYLLDVYSVTCDGHIKAVRATFLLKKSTTNFIIFYIKNDL